MLSFFVELFFDISGSDRCVQFLFLGAKLHRFPHRRIIFSPFSQPKHQNIDARQTSDLNQDAPLGYHINGYFTPQVATEPFSTVTVRSYFLI